MSIPLVAGIIVVALVCAWLGVFVVLRREAMAGAVLVQVSPLGIALALYLSGLLTSDAFNPVRLSPLLLALVLTGLTAVALAWPRRERRPSCRTPGGAVWLAVVAWAAMVVASGAIVLVAAQVQAKAEMLYLLFGNMITITWPGAIGLAGLAVGVAVVHGLFGKEFLLVSFDPDMATAVGLRARGWNVVWWLTTGATVVFAVRLVGAVTVLSLLVLPAATGVMLARRLNAVRVVALVAGVVASVAGLALARAYSLPVGPMIGGVNASFLLLAALLSLRRTR